MENGIWPRKPEPGFHPGIYREKMLSAREAIDPMYTIFKTENLKEYGKIP